MTAQQLMYAAGSVQKLDAKVCKNKSEVRELKQDDFLGSITLDKINSKEWEDQNVRIKVTT